MDKAAFIAALGGATNSLGILGVVFTAANATDTLTTAAHGRANGEGPFRLTSKGDLPTGLTPNKANGTLAFGANASDGDIVTIDSKVYTFQATLTDVDGNVHIGAAATDTLDNLIAAINLDGPGLPDYADLMTLHPTVAAAAGAGDTADMTAKAIGPAGNVVSTTDVASATWTGATLLGGLDAIDYFLIVTGASTFKVATSKVNALAGTAVSFTDNGNGEHTLEATVQNLADALEDVLNEVLLSAGNRVQNDVINTIKFWTEAVSGV